MILLNQPALLQSPSISPVRHVPRTFPSTCVFQTSLPCTHPPSAMLSLQSLAVLLLTTSASVLGPSTPPAFPQRIQYLLLLSQHSLATRPPHPWSCPPTLPPSSPARQPPAHPPRPLLWPPRARHPWWARRTPRRRRISSPFPCTARTPRPPAHQLHTRQRRPAGSRSTCLRTLTT
jgi:hypothetical protein